MHNTTDCKKCIFHSDDKWCFFDIPYAISNPEISIDFDNKTIHNYSCSYAFGKQTLESNKNKIDKDQIINYIFHKNKIYYTLVLNFDTINKPILYIIDKINTSNFIPKNVVCFGKNVDGTTVHEFEQNVKMPWKVNKVLPHIDEVISIIAGVDVIVNKHESHAFLYISTDQTLNDMDTLMNSIHTESVINHNYGIFMNSISTLDGLFMTYDTYNILGGDKAKFFYNTATFFSDNPTCKLVLYND